MKRGLGSRKGVSPVIATVLLVAFVIVIALIIFLWFKSTFNPSLEKFGKNIELVCEDVKFSASYSGSSIQIVNTGDVPLQGIRMKIVKEGESNTVDLAIGDGWPSGGLKQGGSFSSSEGSAVVGMIKEVGVKKILFVPILLGNLDSGAEQTYVCDERFGVEKSL